MSLSISFSAFNLLSVIIAMYFNQFFTYYHKPYVFFIIIYIFSFRTCIIQLDMQLVPEGGERMIIFWEKRKYTLHQGKQDGDSRILITSCEVLQVIAGY